MKALLQFICAAMLLCASSFSQDHPMNFEVPGLPTDNFTDKGLPSDYFNPFENASIDFYRPYRIETDTSLHLYTYDVSGRTLTQVNQFLIDSAWENKNRYTYSYDNSGNLITFLEESWAGSDWLNLGHGTYSYDSNGNLITHLYESWSNGAWINDFRESYTYDSNGKKLTEVFENWIVTAWAVVWRYTYTYDGSGNLTNTLYELWTGNEWENIKRFTYTYENNIMIESLEENWATGSGNWVNSLRWTYTYSDGKLVISILAVYTSSWKDKEKYVYTYSTEGRLLTVVAAVWDNGDWLNNNRIAYTYDNNNNVLIQLRQIWWQEAWWDLNKAEYTFDNNNCTSGNYATWVLWWEPSIGHLSVYFNNGNDHLNFTCKWISVDYDIFTDVKDFSGNEITYSLGNNYPNPFNPATAITYSIPEYANVNITVFDILGNEIETLVDEEKPAGKYEITWNAADLPSGVYFYQLKAVPHGRQAGTFAETKKMILMR